MIREVDKPCYEDLLEEQVSSAIERSGEGDLQALLTSGDTWEVR